MSDKLHIVLAVTNNDSSKHAFGWALDKFVNPKQHQLTIFTVVEPPLQAGYYYASSEAMYSTAFLDEQFERATEEATRVVKEYQRLAEQRFDGQLKVELVVGRGETRDEIVDFVDTCKADLLVIGSRGFGALKRTFVGSTSDYCVHHVHCPVLVVKPPKSH